jgi:peptidoglycan/xylan/chitin deacetylase (PgdA/CDA1 family)
MSVHSGLAMTRQRVLCSFHRREIMLGTTGPFVSFAFDDFPRTAYIVGGSILESFGVRGTYYVAMGLMGASNELGEQFCLEDLLSAATRGHELASHTFAHQSSRRVSLGAFQSDVRKGREALKQIPNLTSTANFAFPRGEVTLAAKRVVGRQMLSCRGIYGGLNGPLVDLNLLRANSLYGDIDRLDAARRLILDNEERKTWLIFYTHDVQRDPSRYGCTPQLLESTVQMAVRRPATRVLPVAEVLAIVARQSTGPTLERISETVS